MPEHGKKTILKIQLSKSSNIDSSAIPSKNPDLCIRNKEK